MSRKKALCYECDVCHRSFVEDDAYGLFIEKGWDHQNGASIQIQKDAYLCEKCVADGVTVETLLTELQAAKA